MAWIRTSRRTERPLRHPNWRMVRRDIEPARKTAIEALCPWKVGQSDRARNRWHPTANWGAAQKTYRETSNSVTSPTRDIGGSVSGVACTTRKRHISEKGTAVRTGPTAVGMRLARVNIDTDWDRSNCRTHRSSCCKRHKRHRPRHQPLRLLPPPHRIRIRDNTLGPRPGSLDDPDDRQWDIRDDPGGLRWDVTDAAHHDSRHRGNVPRACRHRHGTRLREIRRRRHGSRHHRHGEHRHHRGSRLAVSKTSAASAARSSEAWQLPPYKFPRCGRLRHSPSGQLM